MTFLQLCCAASVAVFVYSSNGRQPIFLSPLKIVASLLLLLTVAGALLYARFSSVAGAASIRLRVTHAESVATVWLLLGGVTVLLLAGTVTSGLANPPRRDRAVGDQRRQRTSSAARTVPPSWSLWLCLLPGLGLAATYGLSFLLERRTYLAEDVAGESTLNGLLAGLCLVAVVFIGYLWHGESAGAKVLCGVLVLGYAGLFLALGTRRLALVPILLSLGHFTRCRNKESGRWVVVGGLLSVTVLPLPLYLRGLPEHGLLPYAHALDGYFVTEFSLGQVPANLLVGFPVIAVLGQRYGPLPIEGLWASVSPLPGNLAGWYELAPAYRLNLYTPFVGLGELANYGPLVFFTFLLVLGGILGAYDWRVQVLLRKGSAVRAIVILGLLALFGLLLLQYNLRSAMRILYYALAFDLAMSLLAGLRRKSTQGLSAPGHEAP